MNGKVIYSVKTKRANKKSHYHTTGCDEGIADSLEGLLDTAGAPVELVESGLHWVQPMDYYIHVSRLGK